MEKPRMKRFLEEFRLMNWTLERPTAVIMENMTQKMPPTIGSGIVTKNAPNLDRRPKKIIMIAPYWMTRLDPTWSKKCITSRQNHIKGNLKLTLVTPIAPTFSE